MFLGGMRPLMIVMKNISRYWLIGIILLIIVIAFLRVFFFEKTLM